MSISTSTSIINISPSFDIKEIQKDISLRAILSRIKYSKIPRKERDMLCKIVRNMALENKLEPKFIKVMLNLVLLLELNNKSENKLKKFEFPIEKTVEEEIEKIKFEKREKEKQMDAIISLQNTFSALA